MSNISNIAAAATAAALNTTPRASAPEPLTFEARMALKGWRTVTFPGDAGSPVPQRS